LPEAIIKVAGTYVAARELYSPRGRVSRFMRALNFIVRNM